jgi:hypothetical protein
MTNYDPEVAPKAEEWLATDEAERIAAVEAYHRRHRIRLPRPTLHAAIHTVVESQLALGEPVVIDALARLRSEGLTRHEAVHATGMALADQIYDLLKDQPGGRLDANKPYFDRLKQLTAEPWRKSG